MVKSNTEPYFLRNPGVISSETAEAFVALEVQSGDCFAFSGPSARIWALLEQPIKVTQLVEALIREFDIDETACRAEVDGYLAELEREGLVKAVDAGN